MAVDGADMGDGGIGVCVDGFPVSVSQAAGVLTGAQLVMMNHSAIQMSNCLFVSMIYYLNPFSAYGQGEMSFSDARIAAVVVNSWPSLA